MSAPNKKLISATNTTYSSLNPSGDLYFPFKGANGPTIFLRGSTFSLLPHCTPLFMPGSPSMLHAFLYAQYLSILSLCFPALYLSSIFRKCSVSVLRKPTKLNKGTEKPQLEPT